MFDLDWNEEVAEKLRLAVSGNEVEKLTGELRRSQALERIVPSCFDAGACNVSFKSRYPHKWPANFWLRVRTNDGKSHELSLTEYVDEEWINDLAYGHPFYEGDDDE